MCPRTGGWGKDTRIGASGISAMAWLNMSAAVIEVIMLRSESDTTSKSMKMWMGVVRGRTPKVGKTK